MKSNNDSYCKYLTTLGKQLVFSCFVLFIFQSQTTFGQGAIKFGIGIHTADFKDLETDEFTLQNKAINYHATLGYRIDLPLVFAEAGLGLDVDRYQIENNDIEEFKVILPLMGGIKIFMFDLKGGVMGRLRFNSDSTIDQFTDLHQFTFQYLTGVNVRLDHFSIGIDYLSSSSRLIEKVISSDIIDNSVSNRVFLTLYYKL